MYLPRITPHLVAAALVLLAGCSPSKKAKPRLGEVERLPSLETVHPQFTSEPVKIEVLATVEAFEERIAAFEEVVECRRMFGLPDYVVRVAVSDQAAYEAFYMNKLGELPGLARVNSQFTMKAVKPGGSLPI